jgi:hypothetical protein
MKDKKPMTVYFENEIEFDKRLRLVVVQEKEGVKILVQEWCPKHEPRPDGLRTLWGNIAKFTLNETK